MLKASPPVVFKGGSATLTCTAKLRLQGNGSCNHTSCASFGFWFQNNESVVRLDNSSSEQFRSGALNITSELQLNFLTSSNAGTYKCQLNYGNTSDVGFVNLSVTG